MERFSEVSLHMTIQGAIDSFLAGVGVGALIGFLITRIIYLRGVKDGKDQ